MMKTMCQKITRLKYNIPNNMKIAKSPPPNKYANLPKFGI